MPDRWPWPADDDLVRARTVAREYRRQLLDHAPEMCDLVDKLMTKLGQDWVTTSGTVVTPDEYMSTAEAAALLGISTRAVRFAVERGSLRPAGRRGNRYAFRRADVLAYLAERSPRRIA